MIPLYTENQFNASKYKERLPLKCEQCGNTFHQLKSEIKAALRPTNNTTCQFCSKKCSNASRQGRYTEVTCKQCNNKFLKINSQVKINNFCNKSCWAIYTNSHRTTGIRRSKIEHQLENKLQIIYPTLQFNFNDRTTINGLELDIYIPSLNIAFELNGPTHYEPIYGEDKLNKIQNNDSRKFKFCHENNIGLCIIDISSQKYFKEKGSQKYLDIITNIINQNI